MKQTLNLRQTQRLAMTPQLQQAIRLLQMSTTELNMEIQHAHESNPLLEISEQYGADNALDGHTLRQDLPASNDQNPDTAYEETQLEFGSSELEESAPWDEFQSYLPIDQRRPLENQDILSMQGNIPESALTLREILGNQAIFLFDNEYDRRIAHHIIQSINDAGYLEVSLDDLVSAIEQKQPVKMQDIERVLETVQTLEPVGVAARTPCECLMLQLKAMDDDTPGRSIAMEIVKHCLPALANKDYPEIQSSLAISDSELNLAIDMIQNLNPHPGYSVGDAGIAYVTPDVLVEKSRGVWIVKLNPGAYPNLSINQEYQQLIRKGGKAEYSSLKEQLQHARWLLSNLEKRNQTVLSVSREIVERQQHFFEEGEKGMNPLTLAEVGSSLGIHESTVSRATTGKYLSAPQGIFELKYFFSGKVTNEQGLSVSSVSIRSKIREIIQAENPAKPRSDQRVSEILAQSDCKLARRTVAKYREQMNIPPASKRKQKQTKSR